MKPGSLEAKRAWYFMLGAVAIVAVSAGLSFGGSSLLNGGLFLVAAFGSTYMTKASRVMAFGIWLLGCVLAAIAVFFITMKYATHATHLATSAADLSGNETAITATEAVDTAAAVVGAAGGIFFGFISFLATLVGSVIGFLVGAAMRPKPQPVPAPTEEAS